jgi:pimeloyl-ACP methyl ester carboxylesterase
LIDSHKSSHDSDTAALLKPQRIAGYGNVTLSIDVGGDENAPPVFLLHGGGQTRYSWGKAATELVRKGYRVLNADLRGHGESDWADDGDYRLEAFIGDLHAMIALQKSPPAVIGASLGGIAAMLTLGESDTPLARSLILVDIVPRFERKGTQAILRFMQSNHDGFASLEEAAAAVATYLPNRPRPSSNDGLMKNLRHGDDGRLYWHWDPRLLGEGDVNAELSQEKADRMEQAARRIRVPTLLIRGVDSDVVSEAGAQHLLETIPGSRLVDVSDAGHMVAGDRNDKFNKAILDFLGAHP